MSWLDEVPWNEHELVAVVTQDSSSGRILTVAWMNREALQQTAETKQAVYWSRSRSKLWRKGEESGHVQKVREVRIDCDADAILLTSMDRDGTKVGFDLGLTRAIADAVSVPVIASGGAGTLAHLVEGVKEGHASAVLAASIFHYGTHSIGEAKRYMADAGIAMRLDGLD